MGDRNVVGSNGTVGFGSLSSVAHVDANSVETPTYNQPRVIGENTVCLTASDAKAFDSWDKADVKVDTKRSTFEALKQTVKDIASFLSEP